MNALPITTLADYGNFFENFSRGAREGSPGMQSAILLMLGVAGLVAVGLLARYRLRKKSQPDTATSPPRHGLFERLCQGHALARAEKSILLDMARRAGLAEPSELFVCPALFDKLAHAESVRGSAPESIERLRQSLYGGGER